MNREEAIKIIDCYDINFYDLSGEKIPADKLAEAFDMAIEALTADSVSREEYEETDGVIKIKKQSAKDVGEIKHIVVCSPNYTRYFYNESMQLPSADAVPQMEHDRDWIIGCIQHDGFIKTDRFDKANRIILDALSAKAEWIPCTERLPSDDEYVIVSVLDDHGDTPWKYTTVAWLCNGVWISDNEILCGTAVAWMPLPKPYKGGDAE